MTVSGGFSRSRRQRRSREALPQVFLRLILAPLSSLSRFREGLVSTRSAEELWSVPTFPAAEEGAFMVSWRKRGSNGRRGGKDRRFLHGFGAQEGVLGGGAEDCVQEAGYGMLADSKSLLSPQFRRLVSEFLWLERPER